MQYEWTAIPDAEVPAAAEPVWQHLVTTYAGETNKTASLWTAVPDEKLDFRPHDKVNTIRTILVHQLLSERRFFAHFVGTAEPPAEELLPAGERPGTAAYVEEYVGLCRWRLPQFAEKRTGWCGSGRGCSGGGCSTPATTGPRSRRGYGWPGATSRRSTARPAT